MPDQQPNDAPQRTPQEILREALADAPPGYPGYDEERAAQAESPEAAPHPATPEGDYRTAADAIRAELASVQSPSRRSYLVRQLADMAIRMTAARSGAGLAAVAPPAETDAQEASQ